MSRTGRDDVPLAADDGNLGRTDGIQSAAAPRRRLRFSLPTIVCFAVFAVLTIGSLVLTVNAVDSNEARQLERKSEEVSAILSTSLAEVRSALTVLASLTGVEQEEAFGISATSLLTENVRAIGQVFADADVFTVTASTGGGLLVGQPLDGDRLALVQRASAATDVVTSVIHLPNELRLGYALRSSLSPSRIVLREATINPAKVTTAVRGYAFGDISASLYVGDVARPDQLVLTTTSAAITTGHRERLTVGADRWVLLTNANAPLQGWLIEWSPWIVIFVGVLLTMSMSALVETLVRRRAYALSLVGARTRELELALAQQTELELGQRMARKDAELANQAKNAFLSRMSHELRTPLNGVLGFAQVLELDDLRDSQRDAVQQILKGGWHLLDLINEVLDISRIESGNISLSPEPVLACELLEESVSLIQPLATELGVRIGADPYPGCDVHVLADRQRAKQVLLNLLSNAVKYNRIGGTVDLSCERVDDMLRMNVIDTGPGIRDADLERLFMPFDRLGAEASDVEGTGIGLALSQKLAGAMGGTLTVTTAVGEGSTFTLSLPVVEGQAQRYDRLVQPAVAQPISPATTQHKIIYIEDNLSNLRLVGRILEGRSDLEIVPAMQGRLGLDLVRQLHPFAVLLDLHLPDMDGAEVLRQLRQDPVTASIPVIIVSADATPSQVTRLLNDGAYAYITKPINIPELIRVVTEVLPAPER